jgi:hypothetical protein
MTDAEKLIAIEEVIVSKKIFNPWAMLRYIICIIHLEGVKDIKTLEEISRILGADQTRKTSHEPQRI